MNITISKRAKSYQQLVNNCSPLIINPQSLSKRSQRSLNRQNNIINPSRQQERSQCAKWLFEKCLKMPSNVDQLPRKQSMALKKTATIHKITCRQAKQKVLCIEREPKINLVCNSKKIIKEQDCFIKIVSSQLLSRKQQRIQKESNKNIINEKTNGNLDTKPYGAYASYTTSNQTSKQKIIRTNVQRSLRPSTFISNSNSQRQKTPNKNKLTLSNHFITIMHTDLKPTYSQQVSPQKETIINQNKAITNSLLQDKFSYNFSRFQIVNLSQNELKVIDEDKSSQSINTQYIRKKIQFSSQLSNKNKYQNCIYQPIYMVSHQQDFQTNKKSHKNYYSQLIKIVNVDDQNYFNSAKSNQQQSVVLQKGLDQIFNESPTFKRLQQQNKQKIVVQQAINNSEEDQYIKNLLNNYDDDSDYILQSST